MRDPSFWWRKRSILSVLLRPIAAVYGVIAALRLRRAGERAKAVTAARETVATLGGALDRTLAAIDPYLMQIRLGRRESHA